MRKRASVLTVVACWAAIAVAGADARSAAAVPDIQDADGIVFRYYAPWGYRFQPLLSFGALNRTVSAHRSAAARRLASALVARGLRRGDALYWEYHFSYGGGPAPWRSGFTQAVAAQSLARAGALLGDASLADSAAAAFRGLRGPLVMRLGGGAWIREYGFTDEVILNAQLQSIVSLESYARIAKTAAARRLAADLELAARTLLPRFDLGRWSRYELGGGPADVHYHTYHVELLRRLASTHTDPIWQATYVRWRSGVE